MDLNVDQLVRRAASGDVPAFVELTRRFQHAAFGSALALVHDFDAAEDVVREAFVAAWLALPRLNEPAAFPGWLRGIVRHQAFRAVRRKHFEALPLSEAEHVPAEDAAPDDRIEQRERASAALAAIAELPPSLREPAALFYVHECSHQDIATFLGVPVTTVNNRLHAARSQLKERMLNMITSTLRSQGLPDDFANRIGRLVSARGGVVEALFDPASLPDILTELAVSDEAEQRAVAVQVVQRPGGGIARGISFAPVDKLPRGATVLSSGRLVAAGVGPDVFERVVPLLAGPSPVTQGEGKLMETGIKVIDVVCPLAAGGSAAIAGGYGVGLSVVTEELVRRLSGGRDPMSMFVLLPPPSPECPPTLAENYSHSKALEQDGYSEGTVGAIQTFFFRSEDGPWTAERLATLAPVDTVIYLSRDMVNAKIYRGVDVLTSRSRLLESEAVGAEHAAIAHRAREAIAALRAADDRSRSSADPLLLERARKLQNFFAQPFFVAEPYTKRAGSHVALSDALRGCREILDGKHDDLPAGAFYFAGSMAEIRARQRAEGSRG